MQATQKGKTSSPQRSIKARNQAAQMSMMHKTKPLSPGFPVFMLAVVALVGLDDEEIEIDSNAANRAS